MSKMIMCEEPHKSSSKGPWACIWILRSIEDINKHKHADDACRSSPLTDTSMCSLGPIPDPFRQAALTELPK